MTANTQGQIITFYSYKGGVGRSMILANVAWILASNGKRVLVMDWDLEAPGLHRYFQPFLLDKELTVTDGLIDFLNNFIDAALTPPQDNSQENEENWHEPYARIQNYAVSLEWKFPQQGTIDFVPAGKQNNLYATQVDLFDWDLFYKRFSGGIFLDTVKEKIRADYDYILIDSRTGVNDTSGICTVQMPDKLVLIFSGNEQSILGAADIAKSVNKQWQTDNSYIQDQWRIFPVLSRSDNTEKSKLDLARDYVILKFAPFLQHLSKAEQEKYWGNIEIPYIPWYAYEEVLAICDKPQLKSSLIASIQPLVSYLTNQAVTELVPPTKTECEKILSQFARRLPAPTLTLENETLKSQTNSSRSIVANENKPDIDIFVSYARVDNEPLSGADKGWVTALINRLQDLLSKKLGKDAYSLWIDYDLRGNQPVTPEIAQKLEQASILLLILSPGYLASSWCRWELSTFLTKKNSERILIVEREEVLKPEELIDVISYKFWVKDATGYSRIVAISQPEETEYYQKLDDLARQLSQQLKSFQAISIKLAPQNTIFLAIVSEDLEEYRDEVKRHLEQQGIRVLPDKVYSFANIQQYLEQDLSQCSLFVQLLSDKIAHGLPQFQYERAKVANLPILQWRDSRLDLQRVHDPAHLALLSQSTVIASSVVKFQEYIMHELKPKPQIDQTKKAPLVFINTTPEDMALAHQMGEMLATQGIDYNIPLEISERTKPIDIQKNLAQNLLSCDAVIMLYNDNTQVDWVEEQVQYCRRIQGQREQAFKMIAVCGQSSLEKPPNLMSQLRVLKCPILSTETWLPEIIRMLTA